MSTPVTSAIASNTNLDSEGTAAMATENAAPAKPGEVYAYKLHDIMTCLVFPFLFYEPLGNPHNNIILIIILIII